MEVGALASVAHSTRLLLSKVRSEIFLLTIRHCNDDLSAFGSSMGVRHQLGHLGLVDRASVTDVNSQLP